MKERLERKITQKERLLRKKVYPKRKFTLRESLP
jgi:hypothetical protein